MLLLNIRLTDESQQDATGDNIDHTLVDVAPARDDPLTKSCQNLLAPEASFVGKQFHQEELKIVSSLIYYV